VEKHVWFRKYTAKVALIDYKEISPSCQLFKHQNTQAHIAAILDWEKPKSKVEISVQRVPIIHKHAADS
jgi:hypothetical protein